MTISPTPEILGYFGANSPIPRPIIYSYIPTRAPGCLAKLQQSCEIFTNAKVQAVSGRISICFFACFRPCFGARSTTPVAWPVARGWKRRRSREEDTTMIEEHAMAAAAAAGGK